MVITTTMTATRSFRPGSRCSGEKLITNRVHTHIYIYVYNIRANESIKIARVITAAETHVRAARVDFSRRASVSPPPPPPPPRPESLDFDARKVDNRRPAEEKKKTRRPSPP